MTTNRPIITEGTPCFIIAEAGVNHNGDLQRAYQLIDAAVAAGSDAVKFQTFKAEKLVTATAQKAAYQKEQTAAEQSQFDMLRALELSYDDHEKLHDYCAQQGILFLSTPFDADSAAMLVELGVQAFKVSSGDLTNIPLLKRLAAHGLPIIISTGMANLAEVEMAVNAIDGQVPLAVLHCVSSYPAPFEDTNLRAMDTLRQAFGVPVGYSDHTLGIAVPIAAVARGATIIEKHFTLDRTLPGPDHQASLEPDELTEMVRGIRQVEAALGDGRKHPRPSEANTAEVARRSLVALMDLPQDTVLTEAMVGVKRPGTGLPPAMLDTVIGMRVRRDIPRDTPLTMSAFTDADGA